jgi:hypothetical protein
VKCPLFDMSRRGQIGVWGSTHFGGPANFLLCQELVSQQMTGIALRQRSF